MSDIDYTLGTFVAIDPGINTSGVALFRAGRLVAASSISIDKLDENPLSRANRMGMAIANWLVFIKAEPRAVVVEWMNSRGGTTPKSDSLFMPTAVSGAAVGYIQSCMLDHGVVKVVTVDQGEWPKGTQKSKAKKDLWNSSRSRRILKKLEGKELLILRDDTPAGRLDGGENYSIGHDALDAIAIGLDALGRWDPVRVYSTGEV